MAAQPAKRAAGVASTIRLNFEIVAMVTDLLDDDADIKGGVETGGLNSSDVKHQDGKS